MTPEQVKERAIKFCIWFMQRPIEELRYYIIEDGTDMPICQFYSRSEMYDKFIQLKENQ